MEKITIKIKAPGSLHEDLGVPMDEKLTIKEMKAAKQEAKEAGNKKLLKRATFALNARNWDHE